MNLPTEKLYSLGRRKMFKCWIEAFRHLIMSQEGKMKTKRLLDFYT